MDKDGEDKKGRYPSPLFEQLLKLKVWLIERFRIGERQLMLVWAALIGLLGAVAAECFRKASDFAHFLATGSESEIVSSFAQLAALAKTCGAHGGRPLGWCHPMDRSSPDNTSSSENNHRLHGSNRRRQRHHFGAG